MLDIICSIKILDDGVYLAATKQNGIFLIDTKSKIKTRDLCSIKEANDCVEIFAGRNSSNYIIVRRTNFKVSIIDLESRLRKSVCRTDSIILCLEHISDNEFLVVCQHHIYIKKLGGLFEIQIKNLKEVI